MRENENRSLNPSAYTTPASVFNTLGVDFDSEKETITDINLKTVAIPAAELSKLDPIIDEIEKQNELIENEIVDVSPHCESTDTLERYKIPQDALLSSDNLMSPRLPPNYPIPCEIINALTQQTHSIDPMYVKMAPNVEQQHFVIAQQQPNLNSVNRQPQYVQNVQYSMYPPNTHFNQQNIPNYMIQYLPNQYGGPPPPQQNYQTDNSNSRSLERNNCLYSSRMNSLDRSQNVGAVKNSRSTSLTRQLSAGQDVYSSNPSRSTSLERKAQNYNNRTGSLERNQQLPMQIFTGNNTNRGGSLERNQSVPTDCPQQQQRLGYRGGSLERNQQALLINRVSSLERNAQYQIYKQNKQEEPFQEEIYDFGGANVKSCASIALNKSIAKGIIPANTILPGYQTPPPPYSQHFQSSPSQCSLQQQQQMQHQQQQNPPPPYTQNSLPRVWNQVIPQQQQQNIVNSPQIVQHPTASHLMQQQQHNMSMAQPLTSVGFNPQVGR